MKIMNRLVCTILLLLSFMVVLPLSAQDNDNENKDSGDPLKGPSEDYSPINDIPLSLHMEHEMELAEEAKNMRKKKKRKKNVFYGLKTKRGFTRRGYNDKIEIETFNYLKEPPEIDPYAPEIYWFDFKRKKIRVSNDFDPKNGVILHGPYKRTLGGETIEEGIFYKGTKHGRWTEYDRNFILMDKRKYYKGWPKESMVKYYDQDRTKLKEVIPIVYGQKEGIYYYFYENGDVAVRGLYKENVRVGKWTEYYPEIQRPKKEIQYPSDPFDQSYTPYISKEWNRSRQLVYENKQ